MTSQLAFTSANAWRSSHRSLCGLKGIQVGQRAGARESFDGVHDAQGLGFRLAGERVLSIHSALHSVD